MGIFDLFKKKEPLSEAQKLNKLWDLWAESKAPSPCAALMTYDSEVNNGGHSQYFFNVANTGDVTAEAEAIPPPAGASEGQFPAGLCGLCRPGGHR